MPFIHDTTSSSECIDIQFTFIAQTDLMIHLLAYIPDSSVRVTRRVVYNTLAASRPRQYNVLLTGAIRSSQESCHTAMPLH